ncbi:hypothetical protein [Parasitella parasitica]|uniref:Uncharacterized protein n=1 Tax=Parasitella parasitica TaxID=35722 RepID=A0A0B7NLJ9_9FUNG|nr:hypothetical protein [Parasitella parasitica]
MGDTFENVSIKRIKKALTKFYRRLFSDPHLVAPGALVFVVASQAWVDTIEIPCERHSMNGPSMQRWFVGTILFLFEHTFQGEVYFLAFVEVMIRHATAEHDKSIPVVYKNQSRILQLALGNERPIDSKYAVIKVDDILLQVGLVQSLDDELKFSVIGNYHVFEQDMSLDAADIVNP